MKYYMSNFDSYKEISVSANTTHLITIGNKHLLDDGDDLSERWHNSIFLSEGDRLVIDVTIEREKCTLNGEVLTYLV